MIRTFIQMRLVQYLTTGDRFRKVPAAQWRSLVQSGMARIVRFQSLKEARMAKTKDAQFSGKDMKRLSGLLADVSRATELRPKDQRGKYREAQNSVVTAKRKAEARAGQLRIA